MTTGARSGSTASARAPPRPTPPATGDPEGDIAAYVEKTLGRSMWSYGARVKVHAPADRVAARVPPGVVVEATDKRSCYVTAGSDTPRMLAFSLPMIDEDLEAGDHPELASELRALAGRYLFAAQE